MSLVRRGVEREGVMECVLAMRVSMVVRVVLR